MNLGTIVKTARSKRRMNQTELAEMCGCTQGAISKLESGRFDPSFAFVVQISQALRISLSALSKPFLKRK